MTTDIDPHIAPLVTALARLEGVITRYSCQGHIQRVSAPFVYFHCPLSQAIQINQRLQQLQQQRPLYAFWQLTGLFDASSTMGFRLSAFEDKQHRLRSLIWRGWYYGIQRSRLDRDIHVIAHSLANLPGQPIHHVSR